MAIAQSRHIFPINEERTWISSHVCLRKGSGHPGGEGGLLSRGGEGPAPFSERVTLMCPCRASGRTWGGGLPQSICPLQHSPPYLYVWYVCVCARVCVPYAETEGTGIGDKDKREMREQSPNSPDANCTPTHLCPTTDCWRETRVGGHSRYGALLGREPHQSPQN